MKRRWNPFHTGCLAMVLFALMLAGARGASRAENNELGVADKYFKIGDWAQAETELAKFTRGFTNSDNFAEAVLYQARARFHLADEKKELNKAANRLWNYGDVIDLLNTNLDRAGDDLDEFAFLIGESYRANGSYSDAAASYARLVRDLPNSPRRAEAMFNEAECYQQMKDWPRLIERLRPPEGDFQKLAQAGQTNEWVARGLFLLTKTELGQTNFAAAEEAVREVPPQLDSDLEWSREYLLVRVRLAAGRVDEALQNTTNLLAVAVGNTNVTESRMTLAEIHWRLDELPEAISNYDAVLNNDSRVEKQREALRDIVDLLLTLKQTDEAAARYTKFLDANPDEKGSDFDLLMAGELRMRQYYEAEGNAPPGGIAYLQPAETNLLKLIRDYPDSPYWGKAQLNLGWCLLAEGKIPDGGAAFSNAVERLPFGEDRAVALFKLGDVLYQQKNYAVAISNYTTVVRDYNTFAVITNNLFEPALYQILRASLEQPEPDLATATDAAGRILSGYPDRLLGEPGVLLLGQAATRAGRAAEARATFTNLLGHWPNSELKPEAELAIARTYEREGDWTNVINQYTNWIANYATNPALPNAAFSLAWAYGQASNGLLASEGFSNFIKSYSTNELVARAYLWIGNHLWQSGDYPKAEDSFQNAALAQGATPELKFQARMMAGRAAFQRQDYHGAADDYFSKLAIDTNSPVSWRLEAQYALADATAQQATPTNAQPYYSAAIRQLTGILTNYPADPIAPLAWGRLGDYYKQLAFASRDTNLFLSATNAYGNVVNATNAKLVFRCEAAYGIGLTLEAMAAKPANELEREILLRQAAEYYLSVWSGKIRREDESPDLYWVEKAGFAAGQIWEELAEWKKAQSLYQVMLGDESELPAQRSVLNARLEAVRKRLSQ